MTAWLDVLPPADRGLAVIDDSEIRPAAGLFAAAVAASFGLLDLTVALGAVVAGHVLGRIVPLCKNYISLDRPVVVLLGLLIPPAVALETSGGTELVAGWLTAPTGGGPA